MEVRIGVQHVARELVVDTDASTEDVEKIVAEALEGGKALLTLTDRREKRVVVPTATIGYVEIGSNTKQTVGFAAVAE
ncbi:DUF3107 domain-containing protein [Nesterenkonia aerolata]|uniref:DUF3107 domain-containing protein n=1 Tax=Nesterenkonia aerolata TaxID=3074079 RepID=A0ABU2DP06_9MICC|nr:DUF3107 domain-containing protein [Nesterenkonia sp. LY-0111]MDR8018171.1 DUF3107 domain-containing protein [Nesterenkonia sp. LY-0111]